MPCPKQSRSLWSFRPERILHTMGMTFCALLFLWVASGATSALAVHEVVAWSYYRYPPFAIGETDGMGPDFIRLLNEAAEGQFRFRLKLMPRKRIDLCLKRKDEGVVLFVNPVWMGVLPADTVWSSALFHDSNAVISSMSNKLDYSGPESVFGMKMGGVFGRKYKGLDGPIQSGLIEREDARSEELNVLKVSERRVDFTTGSASVLRYLVNHLGVSERVYFSQTPLFKYTRHLLLSNPSPELEAFLLQFVDELPDNPKWHAFKDKYQLR